MQILTDVILDDADRDALDEFNRSFQGNPYGASYDRYIEGLPVAMARLPEVFRGEVVNFGRRLGTAGVMRIRGLPAPAAPPTPTVPFTTIREPIGVEAVLLACALLLGRPIGFADWHGGDRVQNMYPLTSDVHKQNACNSVYLEMHTETAFRPNTPDVVMLFGLRRGASEVETLLSDLRAAWLAQEEDHRGCFWGPRYAFPLDTGGMTDPKPVVERRGDRLRFNYAEALAGTDAEAERALRRLEQTALRDRFAVTIEEGDLVVIDNTHMIHGRTAFHPRFDGTDRWLQRCLASTATEN